jgi:putative toxin-antitoxin system antitoxin component (TIGR02293 family)
MKPASLDGPPLKKSGGGVVISFVRGSTSKIAALKFSFSHLIKAIQTGLPVQELMILQESLAVPMEQLVPMLGISKATLHRRMAEGRLGPAESDRVVRYARLMGKAVEVMESQENARRWLRSPQFGLGGAVPLEYAETEVGAREVEDLLGRIEYGVYS